MQQIMTGLRWVETEDDRFAVILTVVCGLDVRKLGPQSALSNRAARLAPLSSLDVCFPRGDVSTDDQQLS